MKNLVEKYFQSLYLLKINVVLKEEKCQNISPVLNFVYNSLK